MAKGRAHRQDGRSKKFTFIQVRHDVYDSPAFKRLDAIAVRVLLELIRRHNGANNGTIALESRVFEDPAYGPAASVQGGIAKNQPKKEKDRARPGEVTGWIGRNAVIRALARLEAAGFITQERPSSFTVKTRKAPEYALSWLPVGGRPPSLNYRNITKPEINNGHAGVTDGHAGVTDRRSSNG